MTRDPLLPDAADLPDPHDGDGDEDRVGRLRLTDPRTLIALATVGLVLGWAVRPVTRWFGWTTPVVGWLHVLGLLLAALILGVVAFQTRRAVVHRRFGLRAHEAVNRLVLGKSCALVGALAAGGYAGAALSWVGALSEQAGENITTSLTAAAVAGGLSLAGLLLERACRIEENPPPS